MAQRVVATTPSRGGRLPFPLRLHRGGALGPPPLSRSTGQSLDSRRIESHAAFVAASRRPPPPSRGDAPPEQRLSRGTAALNSRPCPPVLHDEAPRPSGPFARSKASSDASSKGQSHKGLPYSEHVTGNESGSRTVCIIRGSAFMWAARVGRRSTVRLGTLRSALGRKRASATKAKRLAPPAGSRRPRRRMRRGVRSRDR